MAGGKLNSKIKGSTIVEVVISMVVIVTVFGIAMMILSNVLRFSLSAKKLRAQAILWEVMLKTEQTKDNTAQTFTIDDFRVEQEAKTYNDNANLIEIHLVAYDRNQQKVSELQKIIVNTND